MHIQQKFGTGDALIWSDFSEMRSLEHRNVW